MRHPDRGYNDRASDGFDPMRRGHGKLKGSRNERRLCRELSLLVSNGKRDDLLWRSAMSGGTATTARKRGNLKAAMAGDVSSIDPRSHWLVRDWYIEAKHYGDLQIIRSFLNNRGRLYRFWVHTVKEARHYNKKPMLLAKQDRVSEILVVTRGTKMQGTLVMTLPDWDADVYLFEGIRLVAPKRRVRIEE